MWVVDLVVDLCSVGVLWGIVRSTENLISGKKAEVTSELMPLRRLPPYCITRLLPGNMRLKVKPCKIFDDYKLARRFGGDDAPVYAGSTTDGTDSAYFTVFCKYSDQYCSIRRWAIKTDLCGVTWYFDSMGADGNVELEDNMCMDGSEMGGLLGNEDDGGPPS